MASPAAFSRIEALIHEIDIPISGQGRISVYHLANANAEDISATLQALAQGISAQRRATTGAHGGAAPPVQARRRLRGGTAELFSGEVKVSPDKATNSLVIIASQSDYRNLLKVIEELDIPRRQVFVEAVIMEVNLDRKTQLGIDLHQGFDLHTFEGDAPGVVGTNLSGRSAPVALVGELARHGGVSPVARLLSSHCGGKRSGVADRFGNQGTGAIGSRRRSLKNAAHQLSEEFDRMWPWHAAMSTRSTWARSGPL